MALNILIGVICIIIDLHIRWYYSLNVRHILQVFYTGHVALKVKLISWVWLLSQKKKRETCLYQK